MPDKHRRANVSVGLLIDADRPLRGVDANDHRVAEQLPVLFGDADPDAAP